MYHKLEICILKYLTVSTILKSSRQNMYIERVSEIRALRRIFGPKREEEAGGWRKLHSEKFLSALFTKLYQCF
jgi:hypothetical protein